MEKRKGKEKGKLEVKHWQKRKKKKPQSPRRESNLVPSANMAGVPSLIYWDSRDHQPVCWTILSALPPLHSIGVIQCPLTNRFAWGTLHGRHCASCMTWKNILINTFFPRGRVNNGPHFLSLSHIDRGRGPNSIWRGKYECRYWRGRGKYFAYLRHLHRAIAVASK